MTFQEQLREQLLGIMSGMVPDEKKEEWQAKFEESVAPVFESMGKTFERYDRDIRELKAKKPNQDAGVDPRDYEELQRKSSSLQELADQLAAKERELNRKLNAAEKKAQETAERLARESQDLNTTLMSNELRKAMGMLSLAEGSGDEVFDILAKNVRVLQDEKGTRRIAAIVRDQATGAELEKPLGEYVKGWAESSALAKRVLVAPRNSGTGGQGSQGTVGAPATLEMQYADAMKRGDVLAAISLKGKLAQEVQ